MTSRNARTALRVFASTVFAATTLIATAPLSASGIGGADLPGYARKLGEQENNPDYVSPEIRQMAQPTAPSVKRRHVAEHHLTKKRRV